MRSPDQFDDDGAVEVVAMLDDSVVTVKHLTNPRGGTLTRSTAALIAVGVALLLMAAVGFALGVSNARFNERALAEWTESGHALYEFRPRTISLGVDWMTFGGLAGGVLALGFAVSRARDEREQPWFRIGSAPEVEFPTADAPAPSFPLVAPAGDGFVMHVAAGMTGELVDASGRLTMLAELAQRADARPSTTVPNAMSIPIAPGARCRVRAGNSSFCVASVAGPRREAAPLLAGLDGGALAFVGASAMVHLSVLALLWSVPADPRTLILDELTGERRLPRVGKTSFEDPASTDVAPERDDDEAAPGGTGTKMALAEGKMGSPTSRRSTGLYAMKHNGVDPQIARERALDTARHAGILGMFRADRGGAFVSLTGAGDFSSSVDDRDVYGGLLGSEIGDMHSDVWGFGVRGTGVGGGGTGWGTIGAGRYGTIGRGDGTGEGVTVGTGTGGPGTRTRRLPVVEVGPPTQQGDLDKAIIRRHIRKKLNEIKYCYEKQLLVKPDLDGTVTTNFTISGQGAVISVSATGLGDGTVERCVAAAIESIQFPAPTGGGLVSVRYPFRFRSAGK